MIVILFRLNVGKLIFMGIDISDEQKIWRYMDLTKFIHLLTHEYIYFHKVSEFQDKYEGSLTPRDLEKCSPSLAEMTATQREWFFVSCWHINDSESNAMWQIYGKHSECIAIQTDFKTLKECFSETYNDEVEFSKVKYINYENTRMLDDIFSKGSMRVHDVIDREEEQLQAQQVQQIDNAYEDFIHCQNTYAEYANQFYIIHSNANSKIAELEKRVEKTQKWLDKNRSDFYLHTNN